MMQLWSCWPCCGPGLPVRLFSSPAKARGPAASTTSTATAAASPAGNRAPDGKRKGRSATSRWWKETERLTDLGPAEVERLCGLPTLDALWHRAGGVAHAVMSEEWLGWNGRVAELASRSSLSFFPALHDDMNAFSRAKYGLDVATVKPSIAMWHWLASNLGAAWQMRGAVHPTESELLEILGPALSTLISTGRIRITSVSVWSGAGGTRTPLHSDPVHALIYQVVGTKRFFLSSRREVEEAVEKGLLPLAVKAEGSTESFCVDGSLDDVHGLTAPKPVRATGTVATINAGDCLILPHGLYHDVECAADAPASLSLTVRFEFIV
eukprot:TRINITY_DN21683_c0_g1_i2.p1 TRINITY_DN21683_c0_g1~~TRINITY_DN21683_c0_g1_i2.p1  ORF type:complete len:324 (-),score=48.80 TRINITY_DN21683_c0_g1_i2:421-1392(-)